MFWRCDVAEAYCRDAYRVGWHCSHGGLPGGECADCSGDIRARDSSDWGFWYTATTNLKGLGQYVADNQNLTENEKINLTSKLSKLLETIDNEPKSTGWKTRSAIGTRRKWYNPVEITQTVGEFGIWRLRESREGH